MKNYITTFIILILLYALLFQCNRILDIENRSKSNIAALSDSIAYYKNSMGTQTATAKALQLEKNELKQIILNKNLKIKALAKEFSSLKSVVAVESKFILDSLSIKFEEPICNDTLKFTRTGKLDAKWYSMAYKITNDSLHIAPFSTWTETTIITGYKRKWFLGKQTLTTDVTNTNPYITVNKITSAEVYVPQPWYRKWYFYLAVGIAGGILIK